MRFYLGTHLPHWLRQAAVPLFVSHRRLRGYKTMPQALVPWALDSGGFTELSQYGEWRTTEVEYVDFTHRYVEEVGRLQWCAPQDWMCEPPILKATGLTIAEHQHRTIGSYMALRGQGLPVIPVLQGWELDDYVNCIELYERAGVDLFSEPVVGIGSVCRRQHTTEIAEILEEISSYCISLHGFGVKTAGLRVAVEHLASADSMAWSYAGRYDPPLPGHPHKNCANCIEYAMRWRDKVTVATNGDMW